MATVGHAPHRVSQELAMIVVDQADDDGAGLVLRLRHVRMQSPSVREERVERHARVAGTSRGLLCARGKDRGKRKRKTQYVSTHDTPPEDGEDEDQSALSAATGSTREARTSG